MKRKRSIGRWLLIGALVLFGIIVLSVIAGMSYQEIASIRDRQNYPPPGEMIDVEDRRMHIYCVGEGEPAVILLHGLGHNSLHWREAQEAAATRTRVCAVDRAGMGWSDHDANPRTQDEAVAELRALLQESDLPGPYILAGHSYGGLTAQLFAQSYPEEVLGLVLVDSSNVTQVTESDETMQKLTQSQLDLFNLCRTWAGFGLVRAFRLMGEPIELPEELRDMGAAVNYQTHTCDTMHSELENMTFSPPALDMRPGSLGALPLIVITRGVTEDLAALDASLTAEDNAAVFARWQTLQEQLVALSENGEQRIATESGHNIHLEQPALVVEAIEALLAGR